MKKSALLVAAAALALPAVASAQGSPVTATINATAQVQSSVAFSNPSDLDFGAPITPGTAASVTPANGGKIMVSYNTPTTVTVAGTALTHSASAATLPVTYSCAQAATGTATTPTAFAGTCAAGYTTALSGNARTDHWLYVGGDIAAGATSAAPAGNYAGTVTFTATFTAY
jgi:spore coat protein U-like protein